MPSIPYALLTTLSTCVATFISHVIKLQVLANNFIIVQSNVVSSAYELFGSVILYRMENSYNHCQWGLYNASILEWAENIREQISLHLALAPVSLRFCEYWSFSCNSDPTWMKRPPMDMSNSKLPELSMNEWISFMFCETHLGPFLMSFSKQLT